MNQTFIVNVTQSQRGFASHAQETLQLVARVLQWRSVVDRAAVQKFHCEKRLTVSLAEIVNPDDVRVCESCQCANLAPEALAVGWWDVLVQNLQCDLALQHRIKRPPDHGHAALTGLLEQLVTPTENGFGAGGHGISHFYILESKTIVHRCQPGNP